MIELRLRIRKQTGVDEERNVEVENKERKEKMNISPPSYSTDAPPSYQEVVAKLDGLIGSNRTPIGVLEAAEGLSQTDIDILIQNHEDHFPIKDDEDKVKFTKGAAETSSSAEPQNCLNASASAAAATAVQISRSFNNVQYHLAQIDQRSGTSFEDRFINIKSTFQLALNGSRAVANRIAGNVTAFDTREVAYAHDARASVSNRIQKMEGYIAAAEAIKVDSDGVKSQIEGVKISLGGFAQEFIDWAKGREGELTEAIKRIKAELIQLERRLGERETQLVALTHLTQGIAPMAGFPAAFPPYSTAIAIGGLLIAGLSLATTTALITEISHLKAEIARKTREKDELGAELEAIRQAREELEETGAGSISQFGDCIAAMLAVSHAAVDEASKILGWLKDGAPEQVRKFCTCAIL
ncbi:hypothetical protein FQN57_004660 [Myotisia sp. PD_48]|nr:hypothetical protein FQN57_004660 [Myotisia sp. PD_48]